MLEDLRLSIDWEVNVKMDLKELGLEHDWGQVACLFKRRNETPASMDGGGGGEIRPPGPLVALSRSTSLIVLN